MQEKYPRAETETIQLGKGNLVAALHRSLSFSMTSGNCWPGLRYTPKASLFHWHCCLWEAVPMMVHL